MSRFRLYFLVTSLPLDPWRPELGVQSQCAVIDLAPLAFACVLWTTLTGAKSPGRTFPLH